jgi:hypothetical protein
MDVRLIAQRVLQRMQLFGMITGISEGRCIPVWNGAQLIAGVGLAAVLLLTFGITVYILRSGRPAEEVRQPSDNREDRPEEGPDSPV